VLNVAHLQSPYEGEKAESQNLTIKVDSIPHERPKQHHPDRSEYGDHDPFDTPPDQLLGWYPYPADHPQGPDGKGA
jgi:hypothetical protein